MKFKLDMKTNEGWDQFDGFGGLVSFRTFRRAYLSFDARKRKHSTFAREKRNWPWNHDYVGGD